MSEVTLHSSDNTAGRSFFFTEEEVREAFGTPLYARPTEGIVPEAAGSCGGGRSPWMLKAAIWSEKYQGSQQKVGPTVVRSFLLTEK